MVELQFSCAGELEGKQEIRNARTQTQTKRGKKEDRKHKDMAVGCNPNRSEGVSGI